MSYNVSTTIVALGRHSLVGSMWFECTEKLYMSPLPGHNVALSDYVCGRRRSETKATGATFSGA